MTRPDWDTYFMNIAHAVKLRGNCLRRQVAALVVRDRRIISTGYNGTPAGMRNCFEGGCPRCAGATASGHDLGDCRCAHAEENAIAQAARYGVALAGAALYCTNTPCLICARLIISSGIKEMIYEQTYGKHQTVLAFLREAGVRCRQFRAVQQTTPASRRSRQKKS